MMSKINVKFMSDVAIENLKESTSKVAQKMRENTTDGKENKSFQLTMLK